LRQTPARARFKHGSARQASLAESCRRTVLVRPTGVWSRCCERPGQRCARMAAVRDRRSRSESADNSDVKDDVVRRRQTDRRPTTCLSSSTLSTAATRYGNLVAVGLDSPIRGPLRSVAVIVHIPYSLLHTYIKPFIC